VTAEDISKSISFVYSVIRVRAKDIDRIFQFFRRNLKSIDFV
jgi:hypothetical protein